MSQLFSTVASIFQFAIAISCILPNYNSAARERIIGINATYSVSVEGFALIYLIMQRISPSLCGRSRSI